MTRSTEGGRLVCAERQEERNKVFEYRAGERWKSDIEALFLRKLNGCLVRRRPVQNTRRQILSSRVLVFTGHHYVEAGGEIGEIGNIKLGRIFGYDQRRQSSRYIDRETRLILLTGCNTLKKKTAIFLTRTFPGALIIGFAATSTLVKGEFFPNFVRRLPDNMNIGGDILDVAFAQSMIARSWRGFIHDANEDPSLSIGAYNRNTSAQRVRANPVDARPAYMMPACRVWVWQKHRGKWAEQAYPDFNESEQEFWGGRTWYIEDPRYE